MLSHERAEKIAKWLSGWGFEPVVVGPILLLIFFTVFLFYDLGAIQALMTALAALSPVWIPLFLLRYLWIVWMHYIRYEYWFSQDKVLLEVILPPEVEKSPLAMEVVLTTMWNAGGEATFISRIWNGSFRPVWSLEIASNEGRLGYYIYMRRAWRNVVEARLYGQFPEAKINEVQDYVSKVPFNLEEYNLWGCEYTKPLPGAVPIKTYYDYGLDKDPDVPETTVDPLTHILEAFSHIGKGEYLWMQIIIKARKKDEWYGFYKKTDVFKEGGKQAIQNMIQEAVERSKKLLESMGIEDKEKTALKQAASRGGALLTEDERNKVEAIEKSMGKLVFEAGIRGLYIAKKEQFNFINIGASLVSLFTPFNSPDLNTLSITRGLVQFDYPWQDYHDIRKNRIKEQLFFHYLNRAYFYVPYDQTPVFLNIEEVASIWHFPSSAVQTPGLERVTAKRAEAPAGLPTGTE